MNSSGLRGARFQAVVARSSYVEIGWSLWGFLPHFLPQPLPRFTYGSSTLLPAPSRAGGRASPVFEGDQLLSQASVLGADPLQPVRDRIGHKLAMVQIGFSAEAAVRGTNPGIDPSSVKRES